MTIKVFFVFLNSKFFNKIHFFEKIYFFKFLIDGNYIISNPLNSDKLKSLDRLYLDRLWFVLQPEVPKVNKKNNLFL